MNQRLSKEDIIEQESKLVLEIQTRFIEKKMTVIDKSSINVF